MKHRIYCELKCPDIGHINRVEKYNTWTCSFTGFTLSVLIRLWKVIVFELITHVYTFKRHGSVYLFVVFRVFCRRRRCFCAFVFISVIEVELEVSVFHGRQWPGNYFITFDKCLFRLCVVIIIKCFGLSSASSRPTIRRPVLKQQMKRTIEQSICTMHHHRW